MSKSKKKLALKTGLKILAGGVLTILAERQIRKYHGSGKSPAEGTLEEIRKRLGRG